MPTECSAERFDFGVVEGRAVEAAFDGGLVTSDAGALLLGAADRAIDLVGRFADCFRDHRRQDLIKHAVGTLDQLAREINNSSPGLIDPMQARSIAQAELDLIAARAVARALLNQLCEPAPEFAPAPRF